LATRREELIADLRVVGDAQAKRGVKEFGDEVAKTGDKLEGMGHDAGFLKKQIADAETQYKQMLRELDKTGDVGLFKEIRKQRRQLRFFEGLQKELEKELKDAADGIGSGDGVSSVGTALAKGIGAGLSKAGPYVIGGLVGVAALLLPFLGAAVAGAVVGAVGAGGVVGGIFLALQDSRVKAAAEGIGGELKDAFTMAAQDFVGPAIKSLEILKTGIQDIGIGFRPVFAVLAPLAPLLTKGLTGFIQEILPGLAQGLKEMQPAIRALATELPKIGRSVGDFFDAVGDESDGATLGFIQLSHVLQAVIRGTGILLADLSAVFEWSVRAGVKIGEVEDKLFGWVPVTGKLIRDQRDHAKAMLEQLDAAKSSAVDFTDSIYGLGGAAGQAAQDLEDLKTAMDELFGVTMSLDEANLAYQKSLIESHKVLAEGKRTLDTSTEAGQENMDSVLHRIQAIETMRESELNSGVVVEETTRRYKERIEALRTELVQMGFNKKTVDELIARYLAVPEAIQTKINLTAAGDASAWAAFRALERHEETAKGGSMWPAFEARAGGGDMRPGRTYVVGEKGPEVVQMGASGGYVYSNGSGPAAAMTSGPSGASRPIVNITYQPSGDALLDAFMAVLWPRFLRQARIDGGNLSAFGAA
jgi:uncharacterized protein YktA (UPF0223 family)